MEKNKEKFAKCASCALEIRERACFKTQGKPGKSCPTVMDSELLEKVNEEYDKPDVRHFAQQASLQEAACYANRHQRPYVMQPSKTRIVETYEFAKRMGYGRLGLAFCIGLIREAAVVEEILANQGFEVISVTCKAGCTLKEALDIEDKDKIFQETEEAMCNPIFQAELLNQAGTEMNVLIGLCVGHDSLFFKYAHAPTTVLASKDRVTGHNPLAAIYLSDSYYQRIKG